MDLVSVSFLTDTLPGFAVSPFLINIVSTSSVSKPILLKQQFKAECLLSIIEDGEDVYCAARFI